jgi:hypothetical protein
MRAYFRAEKEHYVSITVYYIPALIFISQNFRSAVQNCAELGIEPETAMLKKIEKLGRDWVQSHI